MEALEIAGYCIDKEGKRPPRFFSFDDERRHQAAFTEEEAQLIQQALSAIPDTNPLLGPLRQKVLQHATLFPLADRLVDQHQSQVVARLVEAIRDRRQVRLLRYHSIHSNTISDRLVEPYSFSADYSTLTACEPGASAPKTFRTQRIEDVEPLDSPQTQPPTEVLTDAFDWPGDLKSVSLRLTYLAYHLLTEDYPLTRPNTSRHPDDVDFPYRYTGQVRSWVGLGRFVLGIPGQVRIDSPDEFRDYLRGRMGEFDGLLGG